MGLSGDPLILEAIHEKVSRVPWVTHLSPGVTPGETQEPSWVNHGPPGVIKGPQEWLMSPMDGPWEVFVCKGF